MNQNHPNFSDQKPDLKIKVCGMREAQNIEAVSQLGIDMTGFIFYEKSPRYCNSVCQTELLKVGVFVNAQIPEVLEKVGEFQLDYVQLHGDENPEYCADLKSVWASIKIIKAFSVNEDFDFEKTTEYEGVCDLFLFDTNGKNRGGNGVVFDWDLLKKDLPPGTPKPHDSILAPGSMVFTPPSEAVALDNYANWWYWK